MGVVVHPGADSRHEARRAYSCLGILALSTCALGCRELPDGNPSFPSSIEEAEEALGSMASDPKPLSRPVVILGGFLDPGLGSWWAARRVRTLTGDERAIGVDFLDCWTFAECRRKAIEAVEDAFPSGDAGWTSEVDVVGQSMGGLVARLAATPDPDRPGGRRLRIARLFTIGTPHRGARLAGLPAWHPLHEEMRPGSRTLRALDDAWPTAGYEVLPYVDLRDSVVGPANAAPPGMSPWWVDGDGSFLPHLGSMIDPRIEADIARRLRGEPPLSREPRVLPPPE